MEEIIISRKTLAELLLSFRHIIKQELACTSESNNNVSDETLIDSNEASKILNVSKQTLYIWRKTGNIEFLTFGTRIRYRKSDILQKKSNL